MIRTRSEPSVRPSPLFDDAPIVHAPSFRVSDAPWFSSFQWAAFGGALADVMLSGGGVLSLVGWWAMVAISMAIASLAVKATLASTQGTTDPRRGLALAGLAAGFGALLPLTPWGLIQGLGVLTSGSLWPLLLQIVQFAAVAILLVPVVSVRASQGESSRWQAAAIGAAVFGCLTLLA